jgi:hypothetical protein
MPGYMGDPSKGEVASWHIAFDWLLRQVATHGLPAGFWRIVRCAYSAKPLVQILRGPQSTHDE